MSEPLSEELEAKVHATWDRIFAWKEGDSSERYGLKEILRAFASEIRLQDREAAGKRIADVQNALIQRECGLLQETIGEQADQLLASQETSRQLAEARWIDEIVGLHRAMRLAILRIQRGKNIEACRTLIAALPPPPGPKMRLFLDALAVYRSSEAGRGKNGE